MVCILFLLIIAWIAGRKSGNIHQAGTEEIYRTDSQTVQRWKLSKGLYPAEEIRAGLACSRNEMQLQEGDATFQNVMSIGAYLLSHFRAQVKEPSDALRRMTPWKQFETIRDQKASFYCTQYSAMFAFFCRINGIACREIECKGKNDRHIFNEVFLPEAGVWMYVDLTHEVLCILRGGTTERLAGVYDALYAKESVPRGVYITCEGDSLVSKSVDSLYERLRFNFDPACRFYFYQNADISREFSPLQWLRKPTAWVYAKHRVWSKWFMIQWSSWVILLGFSLGLYQDFRRGRLKKA